MATFTNHTAEDLDFTALGLKVKAGDTFEVPDDHAEGFRVQGFPEVTKKNTRKDGDG